MLQYQYREVVPPSSFSSQLQSQSKSQSQPVGEHLAKLAEFVKLAKTVEAEIHFLKIRRSGSEHIKQLMSPPDARALPFQRGMRLLDISFGHGLIKCQM